MSISTGKFQAGAATRQISRWEFELLEALVFNDAVLGLQQVDVGNTSDLASIRILRNLAFWCAVAALVAAPLMALAPWLGLGLWALSTLMLALYTLTAGYGMRAAILHDSLYAKAMLKRKDCDAMFYRALTTGDGLARWRAAIFWAGVRLGGRQHYSSG